MRRGGILFVIFLIVVLGLSFRLYGTLKKGGAFRHVVSENVEACTRVNGVMGAEDLEFDRQSGRLLISSHDRRSDMVLEGETHVQGAVYLYDPASPSQGFLNLTADPSVLAAVPVFRPHGLSLKTLEDGSQILMVVNHPGPADVIEIFDVEPVEDTYVLRHHRSVSSPRFVSINDVVALDRDRFYASNDHGSKNGIVRMLEDYLRLNLGSVVYFDGDEAHVALKGQTYANGVQTSLDGKDLFVAETTDQRVTRYRIDPATGSLTLRDRWALGFGVDNLDVDEAGAVWVGGHPALLAFVAHAQDTMILSPGEIARIDPDQGSVETILTTSGLEISGLSVAAHHGGKTVVGQVFDDGILICE